MKHATILLVASLLALNVQGSRWCDPNTGAFSKTPGGLEQDKTMGRFYFESALTRRQWSTADQIYEEYSLSKLSLSEKADLLCKYVRADKIDAVGTILANMGFTDAQKRAIPCVLQVKSKAMLDLLVDRYNFPLDVSSTSSRTTSAEAEALIAAKAAQVRAKKAALASTKSEEEVKLERMLQQVTAEAAEAEAAIAAKQAELKSLEDVTARLKRLMASLGVDLDEEN